MLSFLFLEDDFMYKAILFDLDGTLLHMDQDAFLKVYMKELIGAILPLGGDPSVIKAAFFKGVEAMILNDGTRTNHDAFWDCFMEIVGGDKQAYIDMSDAFYLDGYDVVKSMTSVNPWAKQAIELAHRKAEKVVLSTNPVFPRVAQIKRLNWGGLCENDFDLITDYKSDSFCKPNSKYYLSICERIGVDPKDCLMVGNDASDDMKGASEAGMDSYLVTDCLIESEKYIWTGKRGTFAELVEYLEQ